MSDKYRDSGSERRSCPRIRMAPGETVLITVDEKDIHKPFQAKLWNLSVLGMAVQLPRDRRLDIDTERARLSFQLPGVEESQVFRARVRHRTRVSGVFIIGFEFEPLGQNPKKLISTPLGQFVQARLEDQRPLERPLESQKPQSL